MVQLYIRALKSKKPRGEKPLRRGTNIYSISALSSTEVVASRNIYGAVNGITFEAFILRELVPKLWQGACVVMDNAKIHCGEMVKEFIEEAGAKLIYYLLTLPSFPRLKIFGQK
jgi:transposase